MVNHPTMKRLTVLVVIISLFSSEESFSEKKPFDFELLIGAGIEESFPEGARTQKQMIRMGELLVRAFPPPPSTDTTQPKTSGNISMEQTISVIVTTHQDRNLLTHLPTSLSSKLQPGFAKSTGIYIKPPKAHVMTLLFWDEIAFKKETRGDTIYYLYQNNAPIVFAALLAGEVYGLGNHMLHQDLGFFGEGAHMPPDAKLISAKASLEFLERVQAGPTGNPLSAEIDELADRYRMIVQNLQKDPNSCGETLTIQTSEQN